MTRVTFFQKKGRGLSGFLFEGHAGFAEPGSDIVCAAISALVFTCVNALDQLTDDDFTVDQSEADAVLRLTIPSDHSDAADVLLRSLVIGISETEESYPDFVDLIFEEV